jgi:hypothetical protein
VNELNSEEYWLNQPRMKGAEASEYSGKMKPKQEKYLISISKEFSEEMIIKLGKTKGATWEYLLKKLLEKVEGLEEKNVSSRIYNA